jgi:cytochrome c-type biogenesis protein CcmH
MIAFWIAASCLVLAALAFILPPLLKRRGAGEEITRDAANVGVYRDQLAELDSDLESGTLTQEQYEQSRAELERRLLEDVGVSESVPPTPSRTGRWAALGLAVAVPLAAVVLYLALGTPQALAPKARPEFTSEHIAAMVEALASRMEQNPGDPKGWVILARAYSAMGRYEEASKAFSRAAALVPEDAQLLADYAEAMAMAGGGRLEGEPLKLIERGLKLDPANRKALALAATAAERHGDFKRALSYWGQLRTQFEDHSQDARAIDERIAEARAALAASKPGTPSAANAVHGTVRLSPALAAKVKASDTLFIYAQAVSGTKMPLAITRMTGEKFPAEFSLDDSMAMSPQNRLSSYAEVRVVARVSKSGNATPQSGDLEGASSAVKVGANGVELVIDKVIP